MMFAFQMTLIELVTSASFRRRELPQRCAVSPAQLPALIRTPIHQAAQAKNCPGSSDGGASSDFLTI
jgi:hypothetical protein